MNIMEKKILIIEDEESIRKILKTSLQRLGYSIYEAKNGAFKAISSIASEFMLKVRAKM